MCKSTTRRMEAVVVTTDGGDEGLFCSRVYAHELIDKERAGVLVGTGIGGLTMFSDGVQNLIEKGYKKITHFHSLRHNKHGFGSARY
ncbi:putative beta-ketoacyl-[acyl-carrier-protein] synthase I [Helianthus annuus]|nr:putative beta-ketoacyl-[acyl-carrier-protein] synthase I [Helianthus annuus]